jgi:hypothetical protein
MSEATSQPRCTGRTKQDTPCRSFALPKHDTCIMHTPELRGQVEEARRRGGTTWAKIRVLQGKRQKLDTPKALVRFTADVVQDVVAGTIVPDIARAALYGVSIQRQLLETSDLERRLEALEQQAAGDGRGRWPA